MDAAQKKTSVTLGKGQNGLIVSGSVRISQALGEERLDEEE